MTALLGFACGLLLAISDCEVSGWSWLPPLRRVLMALLVLAALPIVLVRINDAWRAATQPPLLFFTIFVAFACGATMATDLWMFQSLQYTAGYALLEVAAIAVALSFPIERFVNWLVLSVTVRLTLSVALWVISPASADRFTGVYGNANPLGAAAGLGLLLAGLLLLTWPAGARRNVLWAIAAMALMMLWLSKSVSAAVATMLTFGVLGVFRMLQRADTRRRDVRIIAGIAVASLLLFALVINQRPDLIGHLDARREWLRMVAGVVAGKPWLGYGVGSSPTLLYPIRTGVWSSAHNLYLEASLYAGVGAGAIIFAFMAALIVTAFRAAARIRAAYPMVVVAVFYGWLSLMEPVLLNAAPSTLLLPLLSAAWLSTPGALGRESWR